MKHACSVVLLQLLCYSVLGCAKAGPNPNGNVQIAQVQQNAAQPPAINGARLPMAVRKIIYTSDIEVVVEDISMATAQLNKLVDSLREQGGYLSHQELTGTSGSHRRGSWTLRVPVNEFDSIVSAVEKLGELKRNSLNTQDITEACVDLEARLKNKASSEQRLLKHLESSKELKDILELERELSRVRGEIEQMQGQLNLLKDKSDLATVNVTMYERPGFIPPTKPSFATTVSQTFEASWKLFVAFGQAVVLTVVALSPWATTACIVFLPWLAIRRLQRKSESPTSAS